LYGSRAGWEKPTLNHKSSNLPLRHSLNKSIALGQGLQWKREKEEGCWKKVKGQRENKGRGNDEDKHSNS